MGEAVMNSEEVGVSNMETERKREGGLIKWERFLPRMALRVMLVEADDSTRQIISVLLRKCSYKVASVADGLKAWEILKARPHEIDLILTEVDLPAISGFALLTLIMEHETCKNIPVIMMSSHDSVSTVYNCMLRGAADYLVKPIRRNELRNLWQHVWRRQSANESDAQQKVEGTSENNTACNDSSSYTASVQRNKERIHKGSDAQSSCSRAEADNDQADNMNDLAESKSKLPNNANIGQEGEAGSSEARDNNNALVNSSREAIDLIGAFNNTSQNFSYGNASTASKFDSSAQLDLSLKRSNPSGFEFENQVTEQRHMINHSDASAFTRYANRPIKRLHPTPAKSDLPQKVYPVPVPVREVFCAPTFRVSSFQQSNCENSNPELLLDQNVNNYTNQNKNKSELECLEERRNVSLADQSAGSSFCNDAATHHNIIGYRSFSGSYSNVDQATAPRTASESKNESSTVHGGNSHRSLLREAALTKFRMKRQERCYEKKVRYESRKKLAEQRPRVKGQFVRQVQSVESDNCPGNS